MRRPSVFLYHYDVLRVRERFDPLAEDVPLVELMVTAGVVHIDQRLVVERDRSHLIVAGRKELDHIVPILLILRLDELLSCLLKVFDVSVEGGAGNA